MSDSNQQGPSNSSQDVQNKTAGQPPVEPLAARDNATIEQTSPVIEDRKELISKARSFLSSPQVRHQDLAARRAFLTEKGLKEDEICHLLQNTVPSIPPRSYPQPPPSHLPVLLLAVARVFTWLAGGSVLLALVYRRFLLPRISQTSFARHSLKSHHLSLLRQLTVSLSSLKESHSESLSSLPHSDPFREHTPYSECGSVSEVLKASVEQEVRENLSRLSPVTLLRCGIQDFVRVKAAQPATEEIFQYLEEQIPWLLTEEGLQFENKLWETLSNCPLFCRMQSTSTNVGPNVDARPSQWEYIPPTPPKPSPVMESLTHLSFALPSVRGSQKSTLQHTLKSLSDFTGYLSAQIYLPFRSVGMGITNSGAQNSPEEDLRREIRALKGLVLNRRSFLPSTRRSPNVV